jgi:hypothetical protein
MDALILTVTIWGSRLFWLDLAIFVLLAFPIFVLSLFIARLRMFALGSIYVCSIVFGLILWIFAAMSTWWLWGLPAVIAGIMIGFVGIVPICFLAEMISGSWDEVWILTAMTALTFGPRTIVIFSIWWFDRRTAAEG